MSQLLDAIFKILALIILHQLLSYYFKPVEAQEFEYEFRPGSGLFEENDGWRYCDYTTSIPGQEFSLVLTNGFEQCPDLCPRMASTANPLTYTHKSGDTSRSILPTTISNNEVSNISLATHSNLASSHNALQSSSSNSSLVSLKRLLSFARTINKRSKIYASTSVAPNNSSNS